MHTISVRRPRIGLLGGSFNPPHWAHLAVANIALTQLALTRVDLMPAGQPWQKPALLDSVHRLELCHLAVEELNRRDCALNINQTAKRFAVEACEIERSGVTYTIDTLKYLISRYPNQDYTLIIGADQANKLDTWHNWQDLLPLCRLAVVARGTQAVQLPSIVLLAFPHLNAVDILNMPPLTLSSTLIRAKLAQKKLIDTDVPFSIAEYITHHRLYI
ncbi:MAG: nicotinate (nicotinamide) nucleotide adenylyltransferase [Pseudomonadota bacterium]